MAKYKQPGVYVEEVSGLPPSVAQVETAIPAFIGYTQKTRYKRKSLINKPVRITSLKEYEQIFGDTDNVVFNTIGTSPEIKINKDANGVYSLDAALADPSATLKFRMYYCLQLYFANGGGPCYIVSAGATSEGIVSDVELGAAMDAVQKEDEPTILLYTDAIALGDIDKYYQLYSEKAIAQAALLKDRVVLVDLYDNDVSTFRTKIGNNNLSYAAAYFPNLHTTIPYKFDEAKIKIIIGANISALEVPANAVLRLPDGKASIKKSIFHNNPGLYNYIRQQIDQLSVTLPPASAIAGVYAYVDSTRGVWKAPANVSLKMVMAPTINISDAEQNDLNITPTGKSINTIRTFTGKGVLVWGARTLAGNDNDWRYVSVRRFFNMVEESVKKATEPFVFEPNDETTWSKIRGMIANFLMLQWRAGALQGIRPDDAFFVNAGPGKTMTELDILEGRLIVEVGMAAVRPAEFIILRFSHKMAQS